MKKVSTFLISIGLFLTAIAQPDSTIKSTAAMKENWDSGVVNSLKQNGGIYAVIVVIAIILGGIFWYIARLDKKISRLENRQKS
jgi:type IV secretory pathway VirB2 component (pilin)